LIKAIGAPGVSFAQISSRTNLWMMLLSVIILFREVDHPYF